MGQAVLRLQAVRGGAALRTRAKVDGTHHEIMDALHAAGIAAKSTAPMGKGYPDLLCAVRSYTCLVEVKAPGGGLEPAQVEFIESWPGDVFVVDSPTEAVERVIEGARKVFIRR